MKDRDDDIRSYNDNTKKPSDEPKEVKPKKPKIGRSKYKDELPVYRYYGRTKRENVVLEATLAFLTRSVVFLYLFSVFAWVGVGALAIYIAGKSAVLYVVTVIAFLIFLTLFPTRHRRYAFNFYSKLKRLSKKSKHRLSIERKSGESVKWQPDAIDLILETHKIVYYVHILHVTNRRYWVYFDSETELRVVRPPIKHVMLNTFGIRSKPKETLLSIDFSSVKPHDGKKVVPAIVILPHCSEMRWKTLTGSMATTGTGGEHFGYMIFTAKSFVNYIRRTES